MKAAFVAVCLALVPTTSRAQTDVNASLADARRLMTGGRFAEAYPITKKAVELSPGLLGAHQAYWRAIDGLKDRSQAARDSEIVADAELLLRLKPDQPEALLAVADRFRAQRLPERATPIEERILAQYPTSMSAELVLLNRYRALKTQLRDSANGDSSLRPRFTRALWEFIDRPTHNEDRLIGDAYRELFYLTDSTTNADTLLRIVRGMVSYEGINPHVVFADGAIALAERGRDFRDAEAIARQGLAEGKKKIDSQRKIYETIGDYAAAQDWMAAFMYDALGVVFMREGRLDTARKQLEHARELDPKSPKALYHLGQLAEQRAQLDEAEQLYIKGSLVPSPGINPSRAALERLYRRRHGSLDGYDAYLASAAETDRTNRKAEVAKSRAANPAVLAPFNLKTLDGKPVSLDSLRGKTAVINAWGMWCGPCVAEMPEIQKLAARYANDSSVRILTIDNDANTDSLRTWMKKKNYTFTTLIDDGYLSRGNLHTFPTTWFVDSSGKIIFTKTGWSERLEEEFVWRIEMIRMSRSPAPTP